MATERMRPWVASCAYGVTQLKFPMPMSEDEAQSAANVAAPSDAAVGATAARSRHSKRKVKSTSHKRFATTSVRMPVPKRQRRSAFRWGDNGPLNDSTSR